ncbi:MAG: hypothetical protein ABJL71_03280, partial [Cyclobacteriaceae bacterium]
LTDGSEFLHIPKTGGTWVISVLKEIKLIDKQIGHPHSDFDHSNHAFTSLEHVDSLFDKLGSRLVGRMAVIPTRFCVVRNPFSWYESWWKYQQGLGWPDWGVENSKYDWHPNAVLNGLQDNDFNEFVLKVLKKRPGYVSELYHSYTKHGIAYIAKTESLRDQLQVILKSMGLQFTPSMIQNYQKRNESKVVEPIVWDEKVKAMVLKVEFPAFLHYDYLDEGQKKDFGLDPLDGVHEALRRVYQLGK